MDAGRELDALVAEKVMGRDVLSEPMCAIFVEGEWSLHPDSSPEGWACYSGMERVMVGRHGCHCQRGPLLHTPTDEDDHEIWQRINNDRVQEWERDKARWGHHHGCLDVVPSYSTDIAAAWTVVEKLSPSHPFELVDVGSFNPEVPMLDDRWEARFAKSPAGDGENVECALTVPIAICLAALRAVGAEVPA